MWPWLVVIVVWAMLYAAGGAVLSGGQNRTGVLSRGSRCPKCLLAAVLILVFEIGVGRIERAEAAVTSHRQDVCGERQDSAEAGYSHAFQAIKVTDVSDTIQFRLSVLNFDIVLVGQNCPVPDAFEIEIEATKHLAMASKDSRDFRFRRECAVVSYYKEFHPSFIKDTFGGPVIDQREIYEDCLSLPNIARQPEMLDANFWTMSGKKFAAGKVELVDADCTKTNSSASQDGSNNRQPKSVVSDSLLGRFFLGILISVIGVFGGGALLWRIWGVR
jgi:hypothetical protein